MCNGFHLVYNELFVKYISSSSNNKNINDFLRKEHAQSVGERESGHLCGRNETVSIKMISEVGDSEPMGLVG